MTDPITTKTVTSGAGNAGPGTTVTSGAATVGRDLLMLNVILLLFQSDIHRCHMILRLCARVKNVLLQVICQIITLMCTCDVVDAEIQRLTEQTAKLERQLTHLRRGDDSTVVQLASGSRISSRDTSPNAAVLRKRLEYVTVHTGHGHPSTAHPRHMLSSGRHSVVQARLAQSVEHETLNLRVVGSSPTLGAKMLCSLPVS